MLTPRAPGIRGRQAGMTMLEVLITLVILAFGLLGLAGLQVKIQTLEMEAYQRAQAILVLRDMSERIKANSSNVASYVPASGNYGTGDTQPTSCTGAANQAERDVCEWSNALKGASESSSGTRVGAMIGGRGCIQEIQAADTTPGVCRPGVYRVSVAWQGLFPTSAPTLNCGTGQYGSSEAIRRAISSDIVIGLPTCV